MRELERHGRDRAKESDDGKKRSEQQSPRKGSGDGMGHHQQTNQHSENATQQMKEHAVRSTHLKSVHRLKDAAENQQPAKDNCAWTVATGIIPRAIMPRAIIAMPSTNSHPTCDELPRRS